MTPESPGHRDADVLAIVIDCAGARRAITISGIIAAYAWANGEAALTERDVKAAVRRLRRAGYKIGSTRWSKTNPPGYYMIESSEELTATVRPLFRQAIDQLRTCESLTGKDYFTRELAGQIRMFD